MTAKTGILHAKQQWSQHNNDNGENGNLSYFLGSKWLLKEDRLGLQHIDPVYFALGASKLRYTLSAVIYTDVTKAWR